MSDALSLIAPDLATLIARSNERQQRQATAVACALAVERSGLRDPRATMLLELLRNGEQPDETHRSIAEALVEELDTTAWNLQEAFEAGVAPQSEYISAFGKAR